MIHRAKRAEQLHKLLTEVERERYRAHETLVEPPRGSHRPAPLSMRR